MILMIVLKIHIRNADNQKTEVSGRNINWSLVPAGFPACQLINLVDLFDLKGTAPKFVTFKFQKRKNLGMSLRIEDKMKALKKRRLRKHTQDYDGPHIDLPNLNNPVL